MQITIGKQYARAVDGTRIDRVVEPFQIRPGHPEAQAHRGGEAAAEGATAAAAAAAAAATAAAAASHRRGDA